MEDFFVQDEVAYTLKDSDASTSASLRSSEPVRHSAEEDADTSSVVPPLGVSAVDVYDNGHLFM